MHGMEQLCFQMICAAGTARSCYIEAIQAAKKSDFDAARRKMEEGEREFLEGHHAHAGLLQKEMSEPQSLTLSLILVHAEDQMMAADSFRVVADELIAIYERLAER